jgi:CheY-like chemotaxis protein
MPVRRAAAAPLQCAEGGADGKAKAGVEPLAPPVVHGASGGPPHVLHIDPDSTAAQALSALLMPEARVTHAPTLAAARELLRQHIFSAVVLDPALPDGDGAELMPALAGIPLLVYAASQPTWRGRRGVFLPKPWTPPRLLWTAISGLLGIPTLTSAGD